MVQDKYNKASNEQIPGLAPLRYSIISKGLPPA